ncbi:MAG: signal peptidase I [Vicinamibacterales bacterium]
MDETALPSARHESIDADPAAVPESPALPVTLEADAALPSDSTHPAVDSAMRVESAPLTDVPPTVVVSDGGAEAAAVPAVDAAPPADRPRARPLQRIVAEMVAGVQTLFSAAVYATLIVTFGFQVARVDGRSMAPTLEDHDRLIVNKLVYEVGNPRPGDIVMLYYPLNPDKMFVKRVIASEGDVVRIVDGHVYVNDVPLHDDYVPEEFRSHDDWGPTVIQQGYYFVMGDHRNNSSDSRHWGQVPKKYIVGKVKVRWWPLQDARIF